MARNARKQASAVAQKWSMNLGNATQQMQTGAQGVTTAPTQLAAANANGYLAGVQQAVSSGKWQAALQAVSLSQWQQAYIQKGIARVQQAANTDKGKVQAAFGPLLDYVYNARDQINASQPRGSLAQNIARSQAMIQAMAGYKASKA